MSLMTNMMLLAGMQKKMQAGAGDEFGSKPADSFITLDEQHKIKLIRLFLER